MFQITLAAARVNAGLTQTDVAKAMRVSKATVGNWESGKTEMKPAAFNMFCEICGVPRDAILLPRV